MSGTRHHFIPKFLLRGFASHFVGNECYAWVYRKDRPTYNSNISNIAIEGHFYTHENRPIVDDLITQAEGLAFAATVDELRKTRSTASVSVNSMATLIAHMESRTRHLRGNFEDIASVLLTRAMELLQEDEALRRFVTSRFADDPEALIRPMREELQSQGLSRGSIEILINTVRPQLSQFPALIESMLPRLKMQISAIIQQYKNERPDISKTIARNGQLRALEQAVAPEKKVAQYECLNYVILNSSEPMPLGDSAVIFEIKAPRKYSTFVSNDDQLIAVYMPLSTDMVLCGYAGDIAPDTRDLPTAVARCSREFFIAAADSDGFKEIQPLISELSQIIQQEQVERLLNQAFET